MVPKKWLGNSEQKASRIRLRVNALWSPRLIAFISDFKHRGRERQRRRENSKGDWGETGERLAFWREFTNIKHLVL